MQASIPQRRGAAGLLLAVVAFLLLLASCCASSAIGGLFKGKSTPVVAAAAGRVALPHTSPSSGSRTGSEMNDSSRRRRSSRLVGGRGPHPQAAAFQGLQRRVLELNNGTRLALAGALAGGFSNLVLYPIDLAKTLRQAGPSSGASGATLWTQARAYGFFSLWAGLTPAILGSMPSSALYFGVYEQVKRRLGAAVVRREARLAKEDAQLARQQKQQKPPGSGAASLQARRANILRRWGVHAVAAAAGNTASSLVFVPKEVLKQQMQTYRSRGGGDAASAVTLPRVLAQILRERGVRGLYSGYRATLLRNIPSAILRFALYEEFKLLALGLQGSDRVSQWLRAHHAHIAAGALAGAISSAVTTPLDVVKTRMAINACPAGGDVLTCLVSVAQREGVPGLYAGLGFRVLYSALFTAVGFSSFEASKALLGVQDEAAAAAAAAPPPATKAKAEGRGKQR